MKRTSVFILICYKGIVNKADELHYNLVTYIIRKTIGLNERAARVFEANQQAKSVVGLADEIRPIAPAQVSGISDIENLHVFENLSVDLEQYKPVCDFTDYQDQ